MKKNRNRKRIRFKSSKKRYFSAEASGRVMLWNIKKVLHSHFADLPAGLSGLSDPRKFDTYTIEEIVMSAIVLFHIGMRLA
jgi:hypothetical protein